jgi:S-adenosylmethionine uptake transporter
VCSLIVSCGNDAITKYLGRYLHAWEIAFFRFLFGVVTLLPWMLYQGKRSFKTSRWQLHLIRGLVVCVAIGLWGQSVKTVPITTATVISFTVPIFVLILAPVFLKERVTWPMWLATLIGFLGILLVLQPNSTSLNKESFYLIMAAGLFGLLDVINKKYVTNEPVLCMLFYSSLVATLGVIIPALQHWHTPNTQALLWLAALGGGSNLILYCLLRAFSLANASSLAPFRYLELLISMGVGYSFFQEMPSKYTYLGAIIIIPCTLFIGYYQSRMQKQNQL